MTTDSIVARVMEAAKLLGDEDSQGHPTVKLSFLRTILQEQLGGKVLVPKEAMDIVRDAPSYLYDPRYEDYVKCGHCQESASSKSSIVHKRGCLGKLAEEIINAMTESGDAPIEYGCHCDLEPHMNPDACVLDSNRPRDCIYAVGLKATGKGKESCQYWQPITIVTKAGEGK